MIWSNPLICRFPRRPIRAGRRVLIDLDVFNTEGRRAAYVMIGCSLFLGRPANGGPGEAA